MSDLLLPQARWRRRLVSVMLAAHFVIVPVGSYIANRVYDPHGLWRWLARYVQAIRLQQYWELFSPDPRKEAVAYRAELRFRDGHSETWVRPYPPNWDFFSRHLAYNFQKWDLVGTALDVRSVLWDGVVRHLEARFQNDSNPLVEIRLIRASARWPPPATSGYVGGEEWELQWHDRILFTWDGVKREFR